MPDETRSHPSPMAARTGAELAGRLEDVLHPVDDQRVVMAVDFGNRGFENAVEDVGHSEAERAAAADDGQHPAAQRGQSGDVIGCAGHRDQRIQFDHAFDPRGGQGNALSGDANNQKQLIHLAGLSRCRLAQGDKQPGAIIAVDVILVGGAFGIGAEEQRPPGGMAAVGASPGDGKIGIGVGIGRDNPVAGGFDDGAKHVAHPRIMEVEPADRRPQPCRDPRSSREQPMGIDQFGRLARDQGHAFDKAGQCPTR